MRSQQWYGGTDRNAYIHRAWMRRGLPGDAFDGRPHIAIANTASDLTPCNAHLDEVARSVKEGIYEAGGIPLNLRMWLAARLREGKVTWWSWYRTEQEALEAVGLSE